MQPSIAQLLAGPWAVLPGRLPFICAALESAARGTPEPKDAPRLMPIEGMTSAMRRRPGDRSVVAVLPFYGVTVQRADAVGEALGLLSLARFTQAFRAALADHAVGAILIDVDSPGGSVYGIAELAEEIYRARARKPIAAIANSLAASGAYWVASAASEFYVTPGGEVGSIGVVTAHQDLSKALRKAGVETTLISAGKHKTEGNPFEPLGMHARRHIQTRVDDYYRMFVGAVAKHRGVPHAAVHSGFGQGRLLDAERAKQENMVDDVAALDNVVGKLTRRIGQGKPVRPITRAAALKADLRLIEESNRRPSGGVSRATGLAAARRREIELLSL